jgi:hypothetical protein
MILPNRACRFLSESLSVIARERSDEAIQARLLKAFVWIASLPLAMTSKRKPPAHGQRTSGGIEDRIESTLPPVFNPKIVPRS